MIKIKDYEFQLVLELAYLQVAMQEATDNDQISESEALARSISARESKCPQVWPSRMLRDYVQLAITSFNWAPGLDDPDAFLLPLSPDLPSRRVSPRSERIGVILVHGVGEQKRFEHLDGEIRKLVESLRAMPVYAECNGGSVVVEITPGEAGSFEADQDIWQIGPMATVQVIAATEFFGEKIFCFHEVWWADVNETYSIAKQIRFWFWGLSVWNYPPKERSKKEGADYVFPPEIADKNFLYWWVKARLLLVGVVFAMLGFSVAIIVFVLNRLFDMETPQILQTITNYVSGVKLYNQPMRQGPSILKESDDFLDNINVPPRYSIRRRMMRALADVALSSYDRWYVLAHSLGTLVAFNGLMETAYTWPGYLDQARWMRLVTKNMAGPAAMDADPIPRETTPSRPIWCGDAIAYRTRIFEKFQGLLTYGSPLEKFATIWPARVPIAREPAFRPGTVWVNAMDPIDPVSGLLKSFDSLPENCCPHPRNIGYRAYWVLLLAHLEYLTPKGSIFDLSSSTMAWLLGMRQEPGNKINNDLQGFAYAQDSREFKLRTICAWLWWSGAFILLALTAALILPIFVKALAAAFTAALREFRADTGLG